MRKLIGLAIAIGFMLQSCVTTEEVTVKKEGNITFSLDMDFSELLKTMPSTNATSGDVKKALDLINGEELSVEQLLDISLLESKNPEQKKDSILKANPDLLKKTQNIRMRVMMNDSVGNIALKVLGKNVDDLNKSLRNLDELSALGENNGKKMDAPAFVKASMFELKKKSFQRKVEMKSGDLQKSLGEMGQMAAMFTYQLKVNFEQPIKSVSYTDALISQDGKSFVKTFKMSEIIDNPRVLEYTVELK
ncbi:MULTISPECIES: hypothetical protein [unclassified Myroides]|uniref:hypothetical protein n=1 Tax=unclassified Myroides TaxID=2642485 RepID=UPI0015FBA87E|nr:MULTISPECIES: hypothetical protein [unclassified Myroides]MBB1150343.1 hypothetical protein [Myroides sp. NP-2]MDM1407989.1 hypothetical protein [Myroides sp. DF42-4-2]